MQRILVVDDHAAVRDAVRAILDLEPDLGVVAEAADGERGLRLALALRPDVVVLDNSMPGMSGLDVARALSAELPEIRIVLLTFDAVVDDLARAAGVHAVVRKDLPAEHLVRAVRDGAPRVDPRRVRHRVEIEPDAALGGEVGMPAGTTFMDGRPLADVSRRLALRLGLSPDEVARVEVATVFRDVGKAALPRAVLEKVDPLLPEERRLIAGHAAIGARILAGSRSLRDVADLVLHHHEWFDGSGYPDGIAGEAIPLGAQIVAAVDALNAIVSPRPYKRGFPAEFAVEQVALAGGRQFGPRVVAALVDLAERDPDSLRGLELTRT